MSRRARHRGARLPALFGFDAGEPTTEVDEVPDNPRLRPCGFCSAQIGEPCTRRTRHGRIPITGYHDSRQHPATQEPPCQPPSA